MVNRFSLRALLLGAFTCFAIQSSDAGMVVTFEDAGIQTSQISTLGGDTLDVETFTGRTSGTPFSLNIGVGGTQTVSYNGPNIAAANQYGGAGGTGSYLGGNAQTIATLSAAQTYFGMWWSAGDGTNVLEFYNAGALVSTFTTADVLDSGLTTGTISALPPGHFGNPNAPFQGQNSSQPYAFLNFFFTDGTQYDEIRFLGSLFESDNHTFAESFDGPPFSGTPVVPEPSSLALLGLASAGLMLGWHRRAKRRTVA